MNTAIVIDPAYAVGKIEVPLSLARALRLAQAEKGLTFSRAWLSRPPTFQPLGLSRPQAQILWALIEFDPAQQTSEYETLLAAGLICEIESDGFGWVDFQGRELRFTAHNRWSIGLDAKTNYQYLELALAKVLGLPAGATLDQIGL